MKTWILLLALPTFLGCAALRPGAYCQEEATARYHDPINPRGICYTHLTVDR